MRICVAHLISFLIVVLALIINSYYLIRSRREFSSLSGILRSRSNMGAMTPNDQSLTDLVQRSMASYASQLDEMSLQIQKIRKTLSQRSGISDDQFYSSSDSGYDEFTSFQSGSEYSNNLKKDTSRLVNYADEKLGATVSGVRAERIDSGRPMFLKWGDTPNPPVNVLRSNMEPGCCYAFKNCEAEIELKLAKEALIETIEIEHIPKSRSPTKDTSSAPRNFSVYGVNINTGQQIHLGDFEFTNETPAQTFTLSVNGVFRILRFKFTTNHGHPKYTCIYRVLVYGQP